MSITDKIRDRLAPVIHAGEMLKGKMSNRHAAKASHWRFKISNNEVIFKIRQAFNNLARKVRSQRLHLRRVTKLDAEILDLVHKGKAINIDALKKLDPASTERLAKAYESGMEKVRNSLDSVRQATEEERARLTSLRETRAADHKVKIAGINHRTLEHDAAFAKENFKMVHDYGMYLILYGGVTNDKGEHHSLASRFKEVKDHYQHRLQVEKQTLLVERSRKADELEANSESVDANPDIQALDARIAAMNLDDTDVLREAMVEFKKDLQEYTDRYVEQLKTRYQEAREGDSVLSPKPLINWKASSGQEAMGVLEAYSKTDAKLHEFRVRYEDALDMPSSRYTLTGTSPSDQIVQRVINMNLEKKAQEHAALLSDGENTSPALTQRSVKPVDEPTNKPLNEPAPGTENNSEKRPRGRRSKFTDTTDTTGTTGTTDTNANQ